ncbi:MAG: AgmX/PglI C-terminal domain-containing protein [Spirochaetota bacterium]
MKQHTTTIIVAVAALLVIAYLLYRDNQREKQIALLLSQQQMNRSEKGGKPSDPYLDNQVKNRIIKGYTELQECYKAFLLETPKVTDGSLKIDWQISTDGKVITPGIVLSPFKSETFHNCMLKKIKDWEFPPPIVRKYVVHTFKFTKK